MVVCHTPISSATILKASSDMLYTMTLRGMKHSPERTVRPDKNEWCPGASLTANLNRIYEELIPPAPDAQELLAHFFAAPDVGDSEVREVDAILENLVAEHAWLTILALGRDALQQHGIIDAYRVPIHIPAGAIAIAEATNLGAKTESVRLYVLKPALIIAAWKLGASFGYGEDNACYLFDPYIGTASFHNPGGEIDHYVQSVLGEEVPIWNYAWSGVIRQDIAFDVLTDFESGEGVIPDLRATTTPDYMSRPVPENEIVAKLEAEANYVMYSACFVDDPGALKAQFPPVHENEYYDHSTIEFQPDRGRTGVCVGDKATLEIYGRVTTDTVDALLVRSPKSKDRDPHITLSTAPGTHPSQSVRAIEEAMLDGRVVSVAGTVAVTEGYHDGHSVVLKPEYLQHEAGHPDA